jgi:hypothetical protein
MRGLMQVVRQGQLEGEVGQHGNYQGTTQTTKVSDDPGAS